MTQPTEEWVQRAGAGDDAAIEHLLVRYLPDLVDYLDRRAAHWLRQRESASDLAQSVCREVLAQLRAGRLTFRGEPQFRQWLYRAAVIKLIERSRRGSADKRDPAREQPLDGATSDLRVDAAHAGATPSEAAMFQEDLERFQRAFEKLSERAREVIALKLIDGLSHKEIGERLGLHESHSRVLLARALAQLAQLGIAT